ncbi:MAG: exodeoxyribonuclease III [Candidatus Rokubacteria bacterium]|nr:exodeoxyribonuclease III [Candidatus Rokubacteria bacterium]
MKLVSWNVNGLRAVWKKGFLDLLEAEKADIVCAQETKIQEDQITDDLRSPAGYRSYWSCGEKKGYSGVVTYAREEPLRAACEFGSPVLDVEGRIVHTEHPDFHLLNVYVPNGGMGPERLAHKLRFYAEFLRLADALRRRGKGIVFGGDVNTAHQEIDIARPAENQRTSGFLPEERAWVTRFIEAGYVDTFRLFQSEGGHYTWWDLKTGARQRHIGWRIDYFFVSAELRARVREARILPAILGSDHCPITLVLD